MSSYYRARADVARAILKAPWGATRKYNAATRGADLRLPPHEALRRWTAPGLSAGMVSRALVVAERRNRAQALLAAIPRAALAGAGLEGGMLAPSNDNDNGNDNDNNDNGNGGGGRRYGLSDALRAADPHTRAVYAVASLTRDARAFCPVAQHQGKD